MPASPTPAPMASRNHRTLILILGLLAGLGPLSIDMYLPAFQQIAEGLGSSVSAVQGSLASYFLGLAIGQIVYGPATDRFGRKRPLYVGMGIYIASTIACALSPSVEFLIAARFFQALGGCAGMVITRAMVRDLFTPQESARIFSLLMLVMGAAPILAPLLGAQLSAHLGWRAIFWILVLTSSALLVAITRGLPETRGPDPSRRIAEVVPVYLRILKDREFLLYALAGGAGQSAMFTYITGSPFVIISVFGVAPENYGYIFGSNAMGLILASQVNARLLKRRSINSILDRSFSFLFLCGAFLLCAATFRLGLYATLVPLFLFIATLGMTFPNTTAGALAFERKNAGSASALLGTLQFALASVASAAVTRFHDGTALPMAAVMFTCAFVAGASYLSLRLRGPTIRGVP